MRSLLSSLESFIEHMFDDRAEYYRPFLERYEKEHYAPQEIRDVHSLLRELDQLQLPN